GSLRFGARAWDGAQAHGAQTEELRIVQNLLRSEIERAYPRHDMADPTHPAVDFRGGQDWVEFLAPSPQATRSGGPDRITIRVEHCSAKTQLVIRGSTWSNVLLKDVKAVRVSYFGAGAWRSSWAGAQSMPSLVRIQVALLPGDDRIWPDLVIAPR